MIRLNAKIRKCLGIIYNHADNRLSGIRHNILINLQEISRP